MLLLLMQVQSSPASTPRGVSVWVDTVDTDVARTQATARLAEAGWAVLCIDGETVTAAEDYFRACPSQQAFLRAQIEGVAWRFDDE